MKYGITQHRKLKNGTEKACYAFLTADIQGVEDLPAMFDDGQNKVPSMAREIQARIDKSREKSQRGLVSKSHIRYKLSDDYQKADFFNNSEDEPFMSLFKTRHY
jgi:hypothetical protein